MARRASGRHADRAASLGMSGIKPDKERLSRIKRDYGPK